MTEPRARASIEGEDAWEPPPILGQVTLIVYGMERGKTELRITWPEGPPDENRDDLIQRRNAFIRLLQSELEVALE